jgi:hypothetical protein
MMSPIPQPVASCAGASLFDAMLLLLVALDVTEVFAARLPLVLSVVCRPEVSLTGTLPPRSVRTGEPLMTVTAFPQTHVNGNTNVRSASLNKRRAVIGVYNTSVRVSVPYLPLEKLGAEPNCHCSSAV